MDELNENNRVIAQELADAKGFLEFVEKFREQYLKEAKKLPYRINLIDELRARENAHSRILEKLLRQETPCGKFEILESFLQFCSEKSASFGNICFNKPPDITQEVKNIDLWVRDKDKRYAIIVENKINRRKDEKHQLYRYIKTTEEDGFDRKNIFVIYLPSTNDNVPDVQTWGEGEENCKEEFKERFLLLSFSEDILTWLTDYVLPNVRLKDKYLSSALEQYIDHLEGKYYKRNIYQKMNMELQELIKTKWELTGTPQKNIVKLWEKRDEIERIIEQINKLEVSIEEEIFQDWKKKIKAKYRTEYIEDDISKNFSLKIRIKDTYVRLTIEVLEHDGTLRCSVNMNLDDVEEKTLPQEVIEKVGDIIKRKKESQAPYSQIYQDFEYKYDEVFETFLEAAQILIGR